MDFVVVLSVAILGYVYIGYPALLRLLVRVRGARPIQRADVTPPVSLVISAYNEASVIRRKLENALALTYPRELLEIVVVSDASDDGTDAIVAELAAQGVTLARQTERRGKTAGLNRTVPMLKGEIVVFSDANAMYAPDALVKLARNFADSTVGCVTGEARYVEGGTTTADIGERAYWDYEIQIKRYETALGSMVGGDGAIYAIRRQLWKELPVDAINDFLNPLQIVAAGWRAVYEPEAVCYEDTAGGIWTEYRRRVRIVSRSWRAVFQAPAVLNPFCVGLFAWALVSHKMLRWLAGVFGALAVVGAIGSLAQALELWPGPVGGVVAAIILLLAATRTGRSLASMGVYFTVINAASLVGVVKGSLGRVSGVWATPRQHEIAAAARTVALVPAGRLLQLAGIIIVAAAAVMYRSVPLEQFAAALFWSATALLLYVYAGYPVLLVGMRRFGRRPVRQADITPRVCMFITANDEAAVIEAKLQNTLALDYPTDRLDIVVASDGSVDETNAIVRRFEPRARLLEFFPRRGKIATLNEGMTAVTDDIVVFSDANTFLDCDAIRALVKNFADEEVGVVSGNVVLVGDRALLGRSEDLYYKYERWLQQAESEVGSMIGADGALYAIRRRLFVPPPGDTVLDDVAIPMAVVRSGYRVVFEAGARAYERGSGSAREEFARKSRVVAGAMQFMNRSDSAVPAGAFQVLLSLVSHKALRWLSPVFAGCAFFASVLLADAWHVYGVAVGVQLGLLALGVSGCVPVLRRATVVALAHYLCLVQLAAAVGFVRGLTGRQSVMWQRFERVSLPASAAYTK